MIGVKLGLIANIDFHEKYKIHIIRILFLPKYEYFMNFCCLNNINFLSL